MYLYQSLNKIAAVVDEAAPMAINPFKGDAFIW